ncbi:hypothetical protein OTU49_005766 [Cherax quadricarinatus]|uniref:Uncharacterized protein n=1 Tax=Cherax quadricarinatus TaxID=27406 RepID=A0AAW0X5Z2_CHEQU
MLTLSHTSYFPRTHLHHKVHLITPNHTSLLLEPPQCLQTKSHLRKMVHLPKLLPLSFPLTRLLRLKNPLSLRNHLINILLLHSLLVSITHLMKVHQQFLVRVRARAWLRKVLLTSHPCIIPRLITVPLPSTLLPSYLPVTFLLLNCLKLRFSPLSVHTQSVTLSRYPPKSFPSKEFLRLIFLLCIWKPLNMVHFYLSLLLRLTHPSHLLTLHAPPPDLPSSFPHTPTCPLVHTISRQVKLRPPAESPERQVACIVRSENVGVNAELNNL